MVDLAGDRFGVGPVVAGGMPSSAFFAGERVESVVGDDDFGTNPKSNHGTRRAGRAMATFDS